MKPHQISAFFLLMTVLLSFTLADERLHVFCEAAALQEPTTHWQEISSGTMHTTADHGLLTSSHKEDRQSRLAASPARPEAPQREKVVGGLITGRQPKNGAAASKEGAEAKASKQCCFTYYSRRLPMSLIDRYLETGRECPKPGIILYTRRGSNACGNPSDHWVQEVKKKLDQHVFQ